MHRDRRPTFAHALLSLRTLVDVKQCDFAGEVGLLAKDLSRIEQGHRRLERGELERLVEKLGFPAEAIDRTLAWQEEVLRGRGGGGAGEDEVEERLTAALGEEVAEGFRRRLAEARTELAHRRAHRRAAALWARFQNLGPAERRGLIAGTRAYQEWAFCVRLCEESERAAAGDAAQALELAELALTVADGTDEDEAWRSRLHGWALLFVANARRVGGDFPAADTAFETAQILWEAGADLEGRLDPSRRFDLEASLRIKQDRFAEAARLLDLAAGSCSRPPMAILLKKSNLQMDLGDHLGALLTLQEGRIGLNARQDPKNWLVLHFNMAVCFWHLGRLEEAQALLPQARTLAAELGAGLRLVRVLWLEGRIAAGLGNRNEAKAMLEQVRRELSASQIGYDTALITLELAILYLEEGRTGEVRTLARELAWLFSLQGVQQDAREAARLFCLAVDQEEATLELVRGLARTLLGPRLVGRE